MPDLQQPVRSVSNVVLNLVKVGRETINSSDDQILKQDMPGALVRVERSSKLLEEASRMLKDDPYSSPARKRLIDGSGGILQATSALLLCFDETEVGKIIRECHRVLDYLAVAEVIETLNELLQFLRVLFESSIEGSQRQREGTNASGTRGYLGTNKSPGPNFDPSFSENQHLQRKPIVEGSFPKNENERMQFL